MKHDRKTKMITIVVLVVIAFGLSIGFAVYSRNLNIQNVQASVAGNPSNFDVVLSTSSTSASSGTVKGFSFSGAQNVSGAFLSGTTISGLSATFADRGGAVGYEFYVYNNGTIPAYLTGITYGKKICKGAAGTNDELVQSSCNNVSISVSVSNQDKALAPKTSTDVRLQFGKNDTNVDGDFTVDFGDITLNYSSQKPSA